MRRYAVFLIGGGISGEAFSQWVSDGMSVS